MKVTSYQSILFSKRTTKKGWWFVTIVLKLHLQGPAIVDQSSVGVGDVLVMVKVESRDVIPEQNQAGVNVYRRLLPSSTWWISFWPEFHSVSKNCILYLICIEFCLNLLVHVELSPSSICPVMFSFYVKFIKLQPLQIKSFNGIDRSLRVSVTPENLKLLPSPPCRGWNLNLAPLYSKKCNLREKAQILLIFVYVLLIPLLESSHKLYQDSTIR